MTSDEMTEMMLQKSEAQAAQYEAILAQKEQFWAGYVANEIRRIQSGEMVGTPEEAEQYVRTLHKLVNGTLQELRVLVPQYRGAVTQMRIFEETSREHAARFDQVAREGMARLGAPAQ